MTLTQSSLNSPSGIYQHQANPEKAWQQNTWLSVICSISICGSTFSPRLDKHEICNKTANILLRMVALLRLWHMDFRLPPEQEYYLRVWRKTGDNSLRVINSYAAVSHQIKTTLVTLFLQHKKVQDYFINWIDRGTKNSQKSFIGSHVCGLNSASCWKSLTFSKKYLGNHKPERHWELQTFSTI